ncbi:MAG: Hpt domain-containing protein, partial [Deferribacterales bacterium]|nr:Hpt domain-containing protein [Deferribacterales bacterium]
MSFDDMQDLVNDFIVESEELIEKLDQDLVELEHRKNDLDLLNGIFRCAHTIKGSSSFLGFDKMATVTHHAEEILNKLRKGEMAVTKEIMDVLLEFVDVVKQLMDDIKNNSDTASIDETVKKLKLANEGKLVAPSSVKTQEQPGKTKESKKNVNKPSQIKKVTKAIEQTIRVDVSRLDS